MRQGRRTYQLIKKAIILSIFLIIFTSGVTKAQAKEKDAYPYLIKVNRAMNTITVYEKDEDGEYTVPVKAFVCSVGKKGTETVLGTYKTQAKYRWKLLMGDVWGQYSTRIVGGILFHSVYYYEKENPASLSVKQYNKLGSAASHGCIRLTVIDAKWIYDNCPVGTTVVIYDDKNDPGPLGKPVPVKIPASVRWDPTDPDPKNPYKDKKPVLKGVKDINITLGDEVDLLKGVTAKSSLGQDITSQIKIIGEVDLQKPGKYSIVYSVTDGLNRTVEKEATITVENMEPPVFDGITDRYVETGIRISRAFALYGVKVYSGDKALDKKLIEVTIDSQEDKHIISYYIQLDENLEAFEQAIFYIDDVKAAESAS